MTCTILWSRIRLDNNRTINLKPKIVMAERIWKDRCEDCYSSRAKLGTYSGNPIPDGISVELCEKCIGQRSDKFARGEEPLPIGLLMSGTWIDTQPVVVVFQDGKRISVGVKFLSDTSDRGIIRLQFPNQLKWLAGGVFGYSPKYAISEVQSHLRQSYFPNQPITFE